MKISKENKTKLIDYLEKYCETFKMSKRTLGYTIRSYHICSPFILIIYLLYGPRWIIIVLGIILLSAFILYYLFNGCIITMLENRLCGNEFTVADPFIDYFGLELNNKNRIIVTNYIYYTFILSFLLIYYYRFFKKQSTLPVPSIVPNIVVPEELLTTIL